MQQKDSASDAPCNRSLSSSPKNGDAGLPLHPKEGKRDEKTAPIRFLVLEKMLSCHVDWSSNFLFFGLHSKFSLDLGLQDRGAVYEHVKNKRRSRLPYKRSHTAPAPQRAPRSAAGHGSPCRVSPHKARPVRCGA